MTHAQPQYLPTEFPRHGRILGLDIGTKRIGVAISNAGRILASPRAPRLRATWKDDYAYWQNFVQVEDVTAIVVGHPLNMDGTIGSTADMVRSYADLLKKHLKLPVAMWDERLSSHAAERELFTARTGRQTRASKKELVSKIDSAAATLILQGFLERLKRGE